MPVLSSKNVLFNTNGKRFARLEQAESYIRANTVSGSSLAQTSATVVVPELVTKYEYGIPLEPYTQLQDKIYLICGDSVNLSATVTGVPVNQLSFEWSQIAGQQGNFANPTEQQTLYFRTSSDTSDKTFIFKVVNNKTNIYNQVKETLYATPTEVIFLSGGVPNPYKLDQQNWLPPITSKVNRPTSNQFGYLYTGTFSKFLKRVELYILPSGGSWSFISSQTFSNGSNFIPIPTSYLGSKFYSKVRFVYSFNNAIEEYVETDNDIYNPVKLSIVDENIDLKSYNTSQVLNFDSALARNERVDLHTEVDTIDVSITQPYYSDFDTTTARLTYITYRGIDTSYAYFYYPNYSNFTTTIARLSGGQIGGG